MRNTFLLSVVALYSVACATSTPAPVATPPAAVAAAPSVSAKLDADQFRAELENAYTHILARNDVKVPPPDAPAVDIEAAASIPIPEHRTINSAVRLFSVDMKDSIQASLIR